jgi:hypothetical protein
MSHGRILESISTPLSISEFKKSETKQQRGRAQDKQTPKQLLFRRNERESAPPFPPPSLNPRQVRPVGQICHRVQEKFTVIKTHVVQVFVTQNFRTPHQNQTPRDVRPFFYNAIRVVLQVLVFPLLLGGWSQSSQHLRRQSR